MMHLVIRYLTAYVSSSLISHEVDSLSSLFLVADEFSSLSTSANVFSSLSCGRCVQFSNCVADAAQFSISYSRYVQISMFC